jgi:3-isopropylmalate dehydrogenase
MLERELRGTTHKTERWEVLSVASFNVGLLPGDGTGPEVLSEAVKVVRAACERFGAAIEFQSYDFGGDRYLRTNEVLPDSALTDLRKHDALLLGAIGHPEVRPGILEKGILLRIRFELDQYINLRPVKLYPNVDTPIKNKGPEDIDFVVVRENSAGLYTGNGGFVQYGTEHEVATQLMLYTRRQVDRCLRYAFDYARKRDQEKTLTLCGKTNVLTYVYDLWERAFHEMGKAHYTDIKRDYAHVDAITMWMVKNPEWFDVVVTGNMFGDIITDLGAMVQGGMGIAAGGNINPEGVSMFEPIGGSAPKYTGKNVINPLACILAGHMMLEHLGLTEAANAVDGAVTSFLETKKLKGLSAREIEESGMTTSGIGDAIADRVATS